MSLCRQGPSESLASGTPQCSWQSRRSGSGRGSEPCFLRKVLRHPHRVLSYRCHRTCACSIALTGGHLPLSVQHASPACGALPCPKDLSIWRQILQQTWKRTSTRRSQSLARLSRTCSSKGKPGHHSSRRDP